MKTNKNNINKYDKKRFFEYTKTVEYTSNRRISITSNLLKINLISTLISVILFTYRNNLKINNLYLYFIFAFILTISIIFAICLFLNFINSKRLSKSKFNLIIKYEKILFGNSLYEEEYKNMKKFYYQLSTIELLLFIINLISIIFAIIFMIFI